ncbi:methyltransferase domain-containing protein [Halarchaeum sp. CBA1220]|uniref:methyltransferase domain-containing protein n=1 Tax=Halarchaeum sp. CBA1220 TaxID=1853682 RepID=UPI000F3A9DDC|nr:methyltransferase domain-containing protein [Halarchaeum sp. CBA1220]QLC33303.1 methyltransferase domain-containing protein [Halarchaeum sp. CBA1220]
MYCLELAGEDDAFAAAEARAAAADGVERVAPGVALAADVAPERVSVLAYTRRADALLARAGASVAAAADALADCALERSGSVAVRARDVRNTTGVDTQRAERELGSVLVERGFSVDLDDPDHELRALFSGQECFLGWHAAASVRDYGTRKPTDRPFFQPGSMDPLLARALCNLAGARAGDTLLDPMCGTGGVLIEAGLVGARALGNDAQEKMVRGASENLDAFLDDYDVVRGDATRLGLRDDAVDCVVFDAPYGRQSKVETHALADLVAGALAEARRVATGRCVLVADRDWRDAARDADWRVGERFVRRVHRSLDRHVLVLE